MFYLVVVVVALVLVLGWAYLFDRRRAGALSRTGGPDEMRNRVEGGMVMGRSWRSGDSGRR